MGCSMLDIDSIQVGDIVTTPSGKQMFYIHNIKGQVVIMSGFGVERERLDCVFEKDCHYCASRILSGNEKRKFFEYIARFGLKFDVNNGVRQC